ncbi:MAG TPA: thioredoxin domain-containing protein [Terriglobia bacterium]|nr:thioredoxin domain-containing protein [Terriglobia bacterium]
MVMTAGSLHAGQAAARTPVAPATTPGRSRLSVEKSPYLLEHARDLVDWHPWGTEAFEQAKKENKLIFLSIGYFSCHWCHVMQREDFENPQVAQLMNRFFISILVDREELPEVDNQYLAVCEMLTGSGGWPLNVIMTPDRKPFFASTYIPAESEPGRPGMLQLIPEIEQKWKRNPAELSRGGEKLAMLLEQNLDRNAPGQAIDASTLKTAGNQLASSFDARNGGFGGAPKFPPALDIFFLLRAWKRNGDANALAMAEKTLDAMCEGGIFDQVGFGFHRYATDAAWRAPHFEKMLYDQALLAMAYTEGYQAARQPRYETTARQILTYVLRDLDSPEGVFYAAQDADSGGVEGGYYLWTEKEIREALDPAPANLVLKVFDIRKRGNFPGAKSGENILSWSKPPAELAAELKMPEDELQSQIQAACVRLLAARQKRIHPQTDEKIITGWNGLVIAAFAKAAQAFRDPQYAQAAERAADFLLKRVRTSDGRLLHVYEGGEAAIPANLNDYAFLTWGLIELYEADFHLPYLQAAVELNSQLMQHFWDSKHGGFFFTADDDPSHLVREKNIDDIELPSGNAVEILNLLRLADMTSHAALLAKAFQTEKAFSGAILKDPSEYPETLVAVDYALGPSYEVVIAGNSSAPATRAMLKAVDAPFLPDKVVLLRPTENPSPGIIHLADYTRYESGVDGGPTAYVCLKYNCKLPTNDTGKMLQLLGIRPH